MGCAERGSSCLFLHETSMSFKVPPVCSLSFFLLTSFSHFPQNPAITFTTIPTPTTNHPFSMGFLPAATNYQSVGFHHAHCSEGMWICSVFHISVQLHRVFTAELKGISRSPQNSEGTSEVTAPSQRENCQVNGFERHWFVLVEQTFNSWAEYEK